jgi:hypothetical protein
MMRKFVLCTLVGGVILFVWGFISHMAIPWYHMTVSSFTNENLVAKAVRVSVPSSGIYFYPNLEHKPGMTAEEKKAAMELQQSNAIEGPVIFAAVRKEGMASMTAPLVISFVINLVTAFLLTWILIMTGITSYWRKVLLCVLTGIIILVVAHLQYWNWYSFGMGYTLVTGLDTIIGFFLAGLLLARFTRS